ncbi:MAG TPA: redoxin domain-containing protein, partial [Thermoguttaceae bacterium]|nr:redoxin domain-containing protein [Thermoguttaceae bacterium]
MEIHRKKSCLVGLVVGLAVFVGCGKTEPAASPTPKGPSANQNTAKPVDGEAALAATSAATATPPADSKAAVREILQEMAKVYHYTPSYADAGRVRLKGELPGQPVEMENRYTAAFVRPDKILLSMGAGNIVCDGKTIYGSSGVAPGWILQRPAPPQLDIESLFSDFVLASSIAQGFTDTFSLVPPQVVLLLAKDPVKSLLHGATEVRLLEPGKIDDYDCHRVEITRPDGVGVFWIDRKSFALRRFEYPVETVKMMMGAAPESKWSLVADFTDAQLGSTVDPNAFRFEMPPDAKTTLQLLPKSIEMLGRRPDKFEFIDADDKPVAADSLADKIVVIDFWTAADAASRETLSRLQKVVEEYKNNAKVRFLPVNVDPSSVTTADLKKTLKELNVDLPIYRDPKQHATEVFGIMAPPTTVVLDAKGVVQIYQDGIHLEAMPVLAPMLDMLLTGKDVLAERQEAFKTTAAEYQRLLGEMIRRDLFTSLLGIHQEMLRASVAEKSLPSTLQVTPLWTSDAVETPGNLLPIAESDGRARILVSAGREVVEFDQRGAVTARHDLGLPPGDFIVFVQTAVDADGRRWFVGSAPGMQQFQVFDDQWKLVRSFPADAQKEPHAGIGDVRLADLNADGKPEICVGYRGLVGVKSVSLEGKVLWSQRALADVFKMAVGDEAPGRRRLFSTNSQYTLAALDDAGKEVGRVELPNRLLYWIAAADLDRDGRTELCGLSADPQGKNEALFLSPEGRLLRGYQLPQGLPGPYVDLVVPAWLAADRPGQWILVGTDG